MVAARVRYDYIDRQTCGSGPESLCLHHNTEKKFSLCESVGDVCPGAFGVLREE